MAFKFQSKSDHLPVGHADSRHALLVMWPDDFNVRTWPDWLQSFNVMSVWLSTTIFYRKNW